VITSEEWAVLGLARSGLATVAALIASGSEVLAWDDRAEARDEAAALGAAIGDPVTADLRGMAGVVVSPGVPLNRHPIAPRAKVAKVPIIGDIELFAQARAELPSHKVVGITGTNGKSTTTALVHHILKTAGVPTTMGGNIGLPILAQDPLPVHGVYVLELSSFQIDLTHSLKCDVAVLLNVTPDHLDRYRDFSAYRAAKIRLLRMQPQYGTAIVADGANGIASAVQAMSAGAGYTQWFDGDYNADFAEEQQGWPALQGPHNAQNAWAARMVCLALGLEHDQIDAGLRTYPGLPHRTERVGTRDGVIFINDSKATNAESAAPALAAFGAIRWILGGKAKTAELDACMAHIGHVRSAYTIGEAGPMFAALLRAHVPVTEVGTLDRAVAAAAADAQSGDTVLLSPACASFDQFRDFEDRGDQFRALVEGLMA
jgi:UDP-N-acetylmuramoylalanine--D-glutamate ligase